MLILRLVWQAWVLHPMAEAKFNIISHSVPMCPSLLIGFVEFIVQLFNIASKIIERSSLLG
eukprot:9032721-Ditylum_brightwellii.AAC.1